MSAKKELEDKIKRKNKVIEEQQLVLDEYRNIIKFLYTKDELRHISVNFAVSCEKGYQGDFDSWFSNISKDWRNNYEQSR